MLWTTSLPFRGTYFVCADHEGISESTGSGTKAIAQLRKGESGVKNVTVDLIKQEIQQLDPTLDQNDFGFRTAVVLMSAAFVTGPNRESLTAFTGYPPSLVAEISDRMHQAGLWRDGAVNSDHWFRGEKWTAGIWTDCLVAEGLMLARQRKDGQWEYRALKERSAIGGSIS
jgi:hypothetical protein